MTPSNESTQKLQTYIKELEKSATNIQRIHSGNASLPEMIEQRSLSLLAVNDKSHHNQPSFRAKSSQHARQSDKLRKKQAASQMTRNQSEKFSNTPNTKAANNMITKIRLCVLELRASNRPILAMSKRPPGNVGIGSNEIQANSISMPPA